VLAAVGGIYVCTRSVLVTVIATVMATALAAMILLQRH